MDVRDRLQPGLRDRYTIGHELGRGGFATVYQAEDLKHRRPVAIKVFHPEVAAAVGTERFLREIDIAAGLSHPHILPLFDSGSVDDLLFYVMPLATGETLRARIEREKQLSVEDAIRLAREIAAGLGHAHRKGLVHRDVKPENVMLSDGLALVADFGIARADHIRATARTTVGTVMGTAEYMSPEQAAGADVDARSDVYALGCVLFEMLAGQPPFTGPVTTLIHQHLSVTPRPVVERRPSVPRAVSDAIARALAKSPADRFATIEQFAEALSGTGSRRHASKSVAVLPFLNLSADPDNEYFADGITDDVIAQLAKVRTLKVISRSSVMPFKKREGSLRDIGSKLGVATLLEGTVRRAGDRVRIVAQLIDPETDENLWAETYDRKLTDIFEIQSDVALQIAGALQAELSDKERVRIEREPTRDIGAYQLYHQGRQCVNRFTPTGLRQGIDYFEQAIARDPSYALAHAGLVLAHTELEEIGGGDRQRAFEAAHRALALDPELSEAHGMLAYARMVFDFDWPGAEAEFRKAIELSPGNADAYDLYGRLCNALERYDQAIELQRRSLELDPLLHRNDLATSLLKAGQLGEAERVAARSVALDPMDSRGHATLGWAFIKQGRMDAGIAEIERAVSLATTESQWPAQLAQALCLVGRTDRARQILAQLEDPSRYPTVSPYHLAFVHTGLGDAERAIDCLEQAFHERRGAMYGIKSSFLLAPLRGHPRFTALLAKMNLV